jgi:hypothetical protein
MFIVELDDDEAWLSYVCTGHGENNKNKKKMGEWQHSNVYDL